jgi:hypothetical protein
MRPAVFCWIVTHTEPNELFCRPNHKEIVIEPAQTRQQGTTRIAIILRRSAY